MQYYLFAYLDKILKYKENLGSSGFINELHQNIKKINYINTTHKFASKMYQLILED